jgi:glycosyltransferase involved in cell wall biosynthesis
MSHLNATISIALCTFNGERFLPLQLASILEQTRPPDEVILCDDGSSDRTVEILEDFAARAPFPVRLIRNPYTLGSTENFIQAISLCTGSLIALSDQDDRWHPTRLEHSERELATHPHASLLFSDADLIDDQGKLLGSKIWANSGFTSTLQHRLIKGDYLPCVQFRFITGATVMFRTSLRDTCFPVGEGWIHDEWLGAATPLFADIHPLLESLIFYRQHASQQIGTTPQINAAEKLKLAFAMFFHASIARAQHWSHIATAATRTQFLWAHFSRIPLSAVGTERLAEYKAFVDFLNFRLTLPQNRLLRLLPVFRQRTAYRKYVGIGSLVKDLLLNHAEA